MSASYTCPHCKNPIYDEEALLCHFCGESLGRASKGFLGQVRYANPRVRWYFIVFVVLLGIVLFLVF